MSKYVNVEKLKYYGNHIGDEYEDKFHDDQWVYRSDIDNTPTIDIVWCKECIHNTGSSHNILCDLWYGTHYPNDFCSCGEREEQ